MKNVWTKSSRSGSAGCVETKLDGDTIRVRDTKAKGAGLELAFTPDEWTAFIGGVKDGEFDL
jgi:hypothetical protein